MAYSEKVMDHFSHPRNVGEIPDADGVGKVGNPICLIEGSLVQLNGHMKEIGQVNVKDRVLTHRGVYANVLQKSVRDYEGPVIKLGSRLGQETLTPDHMIYAIKVPQTDKYLRTSGKRTLEPQWYHAEEVEPRDIAMYPILKEVKDLEHLPIDFERRKFDYRSFEIPGSVPLSADLLRVFGYYLAEGNAVTKVTKAQVQFTFHKNEMPYCEDISRVVRDVFGLEAKIEIREGHNTAIVILNNARLAEAFEQWFGKGAVNKHMPDFMLLLPPNKQKAIIEGMWKGDGYVNVTRHSPRAGYSTISRELAYQTRMVLLRLEIVSSLYREPARLRKGVSHRESYRIHVGERQSLERLCPIVGIDYVDARLVHVHSWIDRGFLHTPITSKELLHYSGKVLNFEVEDHHSFATESLACHNCGDLMWIYIKVKDDILVDVKFKTFGCGAAIATSSMVTEMAKGKTLEEGMKITRKDVADALEGLPPQKMHCSNLAADGLHAAIKDYLTKHGREFIKIEG
ncbi:MAG: iron-sulfur cluster assembly scaffold protein [Methanomassiliicoccales archaeon]|nr:iron-sulfur cluster assembly scaffold protein [Methanomassiliicoccales archaeon]